MKSDLASEIAVGVRCPDCKEKVEECKCQSDSEGRESDRRASRITWTSPTTGYFQTGPLSVPFTMPKDLIDPAKRAALKKFESRVGDVTQQVGKYR